MDASLRYASFSMTEQRHSERSEESSAMRMLHLRFVQQDRVGTGEGHRLRQNEVNLPGSLFFLQEHLFGVRFMENKQTKTLRERMPTDHPFSHLDTAGNPTMVNVSEKPITHRMAKARAIVELGEAILAHLQQGEIHTKKGAVFQTAIIAGVMAAKKTGELIPLCHPLGLENCRIEIMPISATEIAIECTAELHGKTGVEMEALTGATLAALTVYDMCKSLSHAIVIKEIKLLEKRGGKSDFKV